MTQDNFRRLQAWRHRWRQAGKPRPDLKAHMEQAFNGLMWPIQADGVLRRVQHHETITRVLRQWEQ